MPTSIESIVAQNSADTQPLLGKNTPRSDSFSPKKAPKSKKKPPTSNASTYPRAKPGKTASKKYNPVGILGFMVGGAIGGVAGLSASIPIDIKRLATGKPPNSLPVNTVKGAKAGAKIFGNLGNKIARPDKIAVSMGSGVKKLFTSKSNRSNVSTPRTTTIDKQISQLKKEASKNETRIKGMIAQHSGKNTDTEAPFNKKSAKLIQKLVSKNEDLLQQIKSLESTKKDLLDGNKSDSTLYASTNGYVDKVPMPESENHHTVIPSDPTLYASTDGVLHADPLPDTLPSDAPGSYEKSTDDTAETSKKRTPIDAPSISSSNDETPVVSGARDGAFPTAGRSGRSSGGSDESDGSLKPQINPQEPSTHEYGHGSQDHAEQAPPTYKEALKIKADIELNATQVENDPVLAALKSRLDKL